MGILPMRCLSLKPDVCATRSRLNRVILVVRSLRLILSIAQERPVGFAASLFGIQILPFAVARNGKPALKGACGEVNLGYHHTALAICVRQDASIWVDNETALGTINRGNQVN